jgi:cysteine protease ATG4
MTTAAELFHGIKPFNHERDSSVVWLMGDDYDVHQAHRMQSYHRHFQSIMWLTYRKSFEALDGSSLTSDGGWGCMLRSGQMLVAQALQRHYLGGNWRLTVGEDLDDQYRQLVHWMVDHPRPDCIFSLHNLVERGKSYNNSAGKRFKPGEWYGPTTAAKVFRDMFGSHQQELGDSLTMLVTTDGCIYVDEVEALCCPSAAVAERVEEQGKAVGSAEEDEFFDPLLNTPAVAPLKPWEKAILILLPLQLGLGRGLTKEYIPAVTSSFQFRQSVGIIGGEKGHSVYFVGASTTHLHLLDPHTVQQTPPAVDDSFPTEAHLRTLQAPQPLVIDVENVDPATAFGFYCRTREDFQDLRSQIDQLAEHSRCPFAVSKCAQDVAYEPDSLFHSDNGGSTDEEDEWTFV